MVVMPAAVFRTSAPMASAHRPVSAMHTAEPNTTRATTGSVSVAVGLPSACQNTCPSP
ncbi:MAG TPA: hypothetical protein VHZ03_11165 [Trebonia sp.]|jgi:hypothetical protein|nr:hypothetical protein [Trebonia sp.]